ncbi:MAG TPA: sugar porter family MFS transporter [Saprospiraceae bacterium]|nr:sugar porter family MFS transporter [Saprospiraceae bacterium]
MNHTRLFLWSICIALAGFLFGLDTAVISGAEQAIQAQWQLDDVTHGLAVAMALWGTVLGAILGGWPSDRFGRKKTLFIIGILFLFSAIGSAAASNVYSFMVFRFWGGLAIGSSSVTAPLYISEIAPPRLRGRLVALFQFNIVFGILMAYVANYLLRDVGGPDAWRWMLGWVALPSLLFSLSVLTVPESPRWLVLRKGDEAAALAVLRRIDPAVADQQLDDIKASRHTPDASGKKESFFSAKYRFPIVLAFLFAFFNQVSGINAVIYYAPRILAETGMGKSAALLSSAGIGLVNLVFTLLGVSLIDRMGRRFLMYIGSWGYILSLSMVSFAFYSGAASNSLLVPILLFVFIASHAIGHGAVIWVFISEIFPNAVRSYGNSLGSTTHWVFAALIANIFPWLAGRFGGGPIFAFFAVMMVFQLLFVWKMMPETKGVSLEELEKQLVGK